VLFYDLVGSTALARYLDPADLHEAEVVYGNTGLSPEWTSH
jgi:hypothetical protein